MAFAMLHVADLTAGYDGREVLHGLSFDVPTGENLCILGPNGCGKTTLLKAIAALIPSQGTLELDGEPIAGMKRQKLASRIAVMSQLTTMTFSFSVEETVMMGRYQHMKQGLFSRVSKADRETVERCLQATGLLELRNRQINELSGGQLQRVFLARTLAQEPQIILLDEPTNHLDLKHQAELIAYLKEWSREEGHSVIGVLHDINLALRLSDRFLFLRDGSIVGDGAAGELICPAFLERIYGMDVVGYMVDSLKKWEEFAHERPVSEPL